MWWLKDKWNDWGVLSRGVGYQAVPRLPQAQSCCRSRSLARAAAAGLAQPRLLRRQTACYYSSYLPALPLLERLGDSNWQKGAQEQYFTLMHDSPPHHPSYHADFYEHWAVILDILPDTFYEPRRQKKSCRNKLFLNFCYTSLLNIFSLFLCISLK